MRYKLLRPGERKKVYAWLPVYLSDTNEIAWLEYVQFGYTLLARPKHYSLEYVPTEPKLPNPKSVTDEKV